MVMEVKRRETEKLNNRYKINEVHCVVKILQSNSIILSYLLFRQHSALYTCVELYLFMLE